MHLHIYIIYILYVNIHTSYVCIYISLSSPPARTVVRKSISLGRLCPGVVRYILLDLVAVYCICPHGQYMLHGTRRHVSVTKLPLHCTRLPCTTSTSVIPIHFCIFWKSFSTFLSRNTTYPHEAPPFFPSFLFVSLNTPPSTTSTDFVAFFHSAPNAGDLFFHTRLKRDLRLLSKRRARE